MFMLVVISVMHKIQYASILHHEGHNWFESMFECRGRFNLITEWQSSRHVTVWCVTQFQFSEKHFCYFYTLPSLTFISLNFVRIQLRTYKMASRYVFKLWTMQNTTLTSCLVVHRKLPGRMMSMRMVSIHVCLSPGFPSPLYLLDQSPPRVKTMWMRMASVPS